MTQPDTQTDSFQRPSRPVEIVASGMLTPVGANTKMTAASVRAGISAYQASVFTTKLFKNMIMALVPDDALPPLHKALSKQGLTTRRQRMLRLATPALKQALENIDRPLPLMLCGPEKMPGWRSPISDRFLQELVTQTQLPLDLKNSYVFPHGRAGGLHALEAAMQMLEQGQHRQILLGGVDSFFDLQVLNSLDSNDRVLAESVMDGFAPGEAAAFLVLQLAGEQAGVKIHPPGISEEPGHRYSDEPYLGDGLAQAVSEALAANGNARVATVLSSFNGENFSSKEWSVAALRNQHQFDPDFNIVHPADCYGDLGAATVPVLIALASIGMIKAYYAKPALIWASSEFQQRAAVLLT